MTTSEEKPQPSCVDCGIYACRKPNNAGHYPTFCLTRNLDETLLEEALKDYQEEENHRLTLASAELEKDFAGRITRVEETIEFAKRIDAKKIGIASCVRLLHEARIFTKLLRKHGFEVYGVGCKVGAALKTDVGIDPSCARTGKTMCNPILQAKLLNEAHTDLNVVIGLCVGHDSMFYKYAEGLCTTLIVKDRVMGHNPAAVLYNMHSFYSYLMEDEQ